MSEPTPARPGTIFGQEPAVILYVINALVAFLVTIPAVGLTEESAGWVMTIASGIVALLVAVLTRPWVVSALTGALSTILTGLASFGFPITEQQSAAAVILVSAVLGLVLRANVTPKNGPVTPTVVVGNYHEAFRPRR
ncbi:hypothetical protein ACFYY8_31720 [Streptosporangium sp. NPDC001559]|uniref:hypothetical protein n=1 Tax=Streptosporangium sp. NPDC001559 TaxID=3366187 RepID=UPI0036E3D197